MPQESGDTSICKAVEGGRRYNQMNPLMGTIQTDEEPIHQQENLTVLPASGSGDGNPDDTVDTHEITRGCCRRKRPFSCRMFCRKYFWEGQALHSSQREKIDNIPPEAPLLQRLLVRHRYVVGAAVPATLCWIILLAVFIKQNLWHLFLAKYHMTLTMMFASLIAGGTCEAGGAIAFPVMTLAFKIRPVVARDFSLVAQGIGMTAASFTIYFMKIKVEKRAILFATIGSFIGLVLGFEVIDSILTPPQKKIGFVSTWFAFAFALFLLNWNHKRRVFITIPDFSKWKALVLVATGFVGGLFSSVTGSGLDICCFSILTLLFRVSEKTATPTSVMLMALNSIIGVIWRGIVQQRLEREALEYVAVCAPVIVIGAPFGSVIGTHFHRLVLACIIYILDTIAIVTAFAVVPMNMILWIEAAIILCVGFAFFFGISKLGQRFLTKYNEKEKREIRGKTLLEA